MKKMIMILLVCSFTATLHAQDMMDSTQSGKTKMKTDDSKTKIKDNKGKIKDPDGKMKVKDNTDMNSGDDKTKIKDDKMKVKDSEGKVKVKGQGNMNSTGSGSMNNGMGSMTTTTTAQVVMVNGWKTDPANLPVVGNNVPAEVVSALKNRYGTSIYDIKQIRSSSGQLIYTVRIMENGGTRTEYVGADGNTVSQ